MTCCSSSAWSNLCHQPDDISDQLAALSVLPADMTPDSIGHMCENYWWLAATIRQLLVLNPEKPWLLASCKRHNRPTAAGSRATARVLCEGFVCRLIQTHPKASTAVPLQVTLSCLGAPVLGPTCRVKTSYIMMPKLQGNKHTQHRHVHPAVTLPAYQP